MIGELVCCARVLLDGVEQHDFAFLVENGRIARTGSVHALRAEYPSHSVREFGGDVIVSPGFVNGHSHAYQILLRGWADDLPFERWRKEALYEVVPRLTPDDIYWIFSGAFSEMLRGGITTVVEFFYLNGRGNDHAQAAIRAADDAGIQLVLARAWMDSQSVPAAFRETIDEAQTRTLELIARYPDSNICLAPHSLHAASQEMVRAAMECAQAHDLMMHIHVAEAAYEGEQTRGAHGATPVALLDRWGVLNERVVAVHAIYLSDEEKRLLAERGARVVHNPMTNQYLGDGICDVRGMRELGIPIALGTDANVKPSLFEEMRATALLQKLSARDGAALDARAAFDFGTSQGAAALQVAAGALAESKGADYVVVDASQIDPWSPVVNALVYRGENAWVKQTYVRGKCVYDGQKSALWAHADAAMAQLAQTLDL